MRFIYTPRRHLQYTCEPPVFPDPVTRRTETDISGDHPQEEADPACNIPPIHSSDHIIYNVIMYPRSFLCLGRPPFKLGKYATPKTSNRDYHPAPNRPGPIDAASHACAHLTGHQRLDAHAHTYILSKVKETDICLASPESPDKESRFAVRTGSRKQGRLGKQTVLQMCAERNQTGRMVSTKALNIPSRQARGHESRQPCDC
jgi:hypothetical protein